MKPSSYYSTWDQGETAYDSMDFMTENTDRHSQNTVRYITRNVIDKFWSKINNEQLDSHER